MTSCVPGESGAGACIRGTVGCPLSHDELTLLERLDLAEAELGRAEKARALAYALARGLGSKADRLVTKTEVDSGVASARCMAAAARCLVDVQEIPE